MDRGVDAAANDDSGLTTTVETAARKGVTALEVIIGGDDEEYPRS